MARKSAKSAPPDADTRICVLHGPEDVVKREHLRTLRAALEVAHGEIQQTQFDGAQTELADVLDELKTFSLLSTHKLVIIDAAEQFMLKHRDAMTRYATSPVDHATLVLRARTWRAGNFDKAVRKVGAVIKCEQPSPAEARKWLVDEARRLHGVKLPGSAADRLIEAHGADLMLLSAELGKIAAIAGDDGKIDDDLVAELVGRSSDEKAWLIQETLLANLNPAQRLAATQRTQAILRKVHDLAELAGHDTVPIQWAVTDLMRKLCLGLALRRSGMNDFQVARQMRFWGDSIKAFTALLRELDQPTAMRWFDRVIAADRGGKSGLGNPMRNLECFCALLADDV